MAEYRYKELESDEEFRILKLYPGDDGPDDVIRCEINHYESPRKDAASAVEYEALSWTWDDDAADQTDKLASDYAKLAIVDSVDSKQPDAIKMIKSNLHAALKALRHRTQDRKLWVDYVCINQDNIGEKNNQVKMMSLIYGKAKNVCIWLGEPATDGHKALEFIKHKACDFNLFAEITAEDRAPEIKAGWEALATLMNRPWFRRRWVVQEVALAHSATVHVGGDFVTWHQLETAVTLFEREHKKLEVLYKGSKASGFDRQYFGNVQATSAARLVRAKSDLFRWNNKGGIIEYRFSLGELVVNLFDFEGKNPHDLFYALLSLASDTRDRIAVEREPQSNGHHESNDVPPAVDEPALEPSPAGRAALKIPAFRKAVTNLQQAAHNPTVFPVDYEQDFFGVCKGFLHFVMSRKSFPNLDILCRPWAPRGKKDLPSWIPSASNAAFTRRPNIAAPGGVQMQRKNADPLVAMQASGGSYYNACNGLIASGKEKHWYFGNRSGPDRRLFVTGFILDTIGEIGETSQGGIIPAEWLTLGQWEPWDEHEKIIPNNPPPDELWQTLVADRGADGRHPSGYFRGVFEFCVHQSTAMTGLQTADLQQRDHPIVDEFLSRIEAVVWGRKLFRSDIEQKLGLAPKKARFGDGQYRSCQYSFSRNRD